MRRKKSSKEKNYRQYVFVIRQLTSREMKRKYARSYLGIVWSVLNPLLSMSVLSLIFSHMFRRNIEDYPVYYLTGYLLWQAFTGSTNAAVTTLADNKALLLKVKFPMELLVLARVYTALVNLGYSMLAYAVMLIAFRIPLKWTAAAAPAVIGLLFLFSLGVSYVLAVAYVFYGDVKHLYSVILMLWMYCSAIFYPVEQLSSSVRVLVRSNPVYAYIACLRNVILYGKIPEAVLWIQMIFWSVGMWLIGQYVFRRNRNKIMQKA